VDHVILFERDNDVKHLEIMLKFTGKLHTMRIMISKFESP